MKGKTFFVRIQTVYLVILGALGVALLAVGFYGTETLEGLLAGGPTQTTASQGNPDEKKPVDALRVNAPQPVAKESSAAAPAKAPQENFFSEFRLERERNRSQQVEYLREIVNNPQTGADTRKEAQKKIMDMAEVLKKEQELEKLIQVQGYKDAAVFIKPSSVTVIVQAKSLKQEEMAKLTELAVRMTGKKPEDVVVLNKG